MREWNIWGLQRRGLAVEETEWEDQRALRMIKNE